MKNAKKFLNYLISPFALGFLVTLFFVYASLDYYSSQHLSLKREITLAGLLQMIHEKSIDWRLVDRGQVPPSDQVAILAVDEASIEQEGRWPWARDKQAKMIEKAMSHGAKVVAFDIIYAEEDGNSSIPTLRKLRRELKEKQKLTPEIDSRLEEEIKNSDTDQIFAETIRKYSNSLVLGAYFEAAEEMNMANLHPGYVDYCIEALHETTSASKYWKREEAKITIIDDVAIKIGFPQALKNHLISYFQVIEANAAQEWFQNHPEITSRIGLTMEEVLNTLPVEAYPLVATLVLNNDVETMKMVLEQVDPEHATPENAKYVMMRFGNSLEKSEASALLETIKSDSHDYCVQRFFTEKDELLHLNKYKEKWGDAPEITEQFNTAHSWQFAWSELQKANADRANQTLDSAVARFRSSTLPNAILSVDKWWVNIPKISDATKHTGFFNAKLDSDGTIRRGYLFVRRGNDYSSPISLKSFLLSKNLSAIGVLSIEDVGREEASGKVVKSLQIDDADANTVMQIPIDRRGQLMINFAGGRNMFPYITAADLFNDKPQMRIQVQEFDADTQRWYLREKMVNKTEFLKDKLLIAGATAIGVYDLRVTPFEENFPGVETHANLLSNLLAEYARVKGEKVNPLTPGFLRSSPQEEKIMWLVLLAIGLSLTALLSYFGSVIGLGITALFLGSVYGVDKYLLFKSGTVVTVIFPIFLIVSTFVALTFYKYFTEERKKRELKGTFEKYVSPSIVAEVLADPENIELGGRKVELTVMFSDVRGFTTISEKLDPRELSNLLNTYLTPMTNLVFKNKGTLDKYMGDAIMAFWGAPIHFPDHAAHACRCALQMIEKLKELQAQFAERGLPMIDIGIGLNTGEMSVGNMGSDTVRSYTVMGDAVNLGSRLEGINKEYGTRIIISEFTHAAVKNGFVSREVDWVRVKGKLKPVRIFELIAEGQPDSRTAEILKHFNDGFQLYHERKFADSIDSFSRALGINGDDAVSQLYIERCQDYLKVPPPDDWDGVFTMTTK